MHIIITKSKNTIISDDLQSTTCNDVEQLILTEIMALVSKQGQEQKDKKSCIVYSDGACLNQGMITELRGVQPSDYSRCAGGNYMWNSIFHRFSNLYINSPELKQKMSIL